MVGHFFILAGHAATLVAHNIAFDHRIMAIATARVARTWARLPQVCTMEKTPDICCLPPTDRMIAAGRLEHKAPRLAEAYEHLFDAAMPGQAHDALSDVRACAAIWLELQERARRPAWLQERWPAVAF